MTSIGWATLDVIPSFKGLAGELDRGSRGPLGAAGTRGGSEFGDKAGKAASGRFGSIFSKAAKATLLGVAGGAAVAFKVGKDSVKQASDLGESLNAVNVTYGKQARGVKRLGRESAQALGLSNSQFNGLAVQYSAFAKTIGGDKKVVQTLDDLTTRASDFASVMNLEVADAAGLFQSGLAGESEPLRKYGIDLSAAAVESFAYAEGIAEAGEKLTEAQKVQARYASIMEQTSKTQGDFANTSDSLANRQRILSARWDDARAKLGNGLLPIIEDATGFILDKGIPAFEKFSGWFNKKGIPALETFGGHAKTTFDKIRDLVGIFNDLPTAGKLASIGGALAGGLVIKHKLAGIFDRGGIGNPMFVVVTNPGGIGGGAGGAGKHKGAGLGAKAVGVATGIGAATVAIPLVDALAKNTGVNERLESSVGSLGERFGKWAGLPDVIGKDTRSDPRDFKAGNLVTFEGGVDTSKMDAFLDASRAKAAGLGRELDLVGARKLTPRINNSSIKDANAALAVFIDKQIAAGRPIAPHVSLNGYDRVIDQLNTIAAKVHAVTGAGLDNGVPYLSGGAGVVNNFTGPINATDTKDITRQAQRKAQERGLGGRAW